MPDTENEQVLGGHAVMCVGYDDTNQWFIVRNSWGTDWGDGGYFYMPYAYMTNSQLANDFWEITAVSKNSIKNNNIIKSKNQNMNSYLYNININNIYII